MLSCLGAVVCVAVGIAAALGAAALCGACQICRPVPAHAYHPLSAAQCRRDVPRTRQRMGDETGVGETLSSRWAPDGTA